MRPLFFCVIAAFVPFTVQAQNANPATVSPFLLNQNIYTQDFDSLASTGATGSTLPTGFQIIESGSNANATYGIGNGSSNAGNSYSFGAMGGTDRALGSLGSGNLTPIMYGGVFTNALGNMITSLTFSYTGEQWRLGNSTDDGLAFQYRLGATDVGGTAGWTTVNSLFFTPLNTNGTSTGAAVDGNAVANQRALTGTIGGLSLANGGSFGFRWIDADSTGADQGLAVDNLSITASTPIVAAVPEPATWAMMIAGLGLIGGTMRRRRAAGFLATV